MNRNRKAVPARRQPKTLDLEKKKKEQEEEKLKKEKEEEEERLKKEAEEEDERKKQAEEMVDQDEDNPKGKDNENGDKDQNERSFDDEENERYESQGVEGEEEDEAYGEGDEEEINDEAYDAEDENRYDEENNSDPEKEFDQNGYGREDSNENTSSSAEFESKGNSSKTDTRSTNTFTGKSRATYNVASSRSWAIQRAYDDDFEADVEAMKDLGPTDPALMRASDRFEDLSYEGKTDPPPAPEPIPDQPRDSKRCEFFVNGDGARNPVIFTINKKTCRTFSALKSELTNKAKTKCENIFHITSGQKVASLEQIHHGDRYAFGPKTIKDLIKADYGTAATKWSNRPVSTKVGKIRASELSLLSKDPAKKQPAPPTQRGQPRIMTITNSCNRGIKAKIIFNPNSKQNFEDILREMGEMVEVSGARKLYTEGMRCIPVDSFSKLRELRDIDSFLVCGDEEPPELRHQKEMADDWIAKNPKAKKKDRDSGHSSISTLTDSSSVHTGGRFTQNGAFDPTPDFEIDDMAVRKNKKDTEGKNKNSEMTVVNRRSFPQRSRDNETVRMYMKGRQKEFYVPRNMQNPPHDGSRPLKAPRLDWAYGYRGHDTANNMHILPSGDLAYYTGTVGVVYNRKENKQMHYIGHTEDITCMAVHPERNIIATGQVGGTPQSSPMWWPHVRVWEATLNPETGTMNTLHVIGTKTLLEGVSSVAFCGAGKGISFGELLMVIDESDKHYMYVYKWEETNDGILVAKSPSISSRYHTDLQPASDTVVWGHFHPHNCTDLFTHGKNHVHVWKLLWDPKAKFEDGWQQNGRRVLKPNGTILLDKKGGLFEDVPKFVTAMAFNNEDVIVGDWNGKITIFSRDEEDAFVINRDFEYAEALSSAHRNPIFSLLVLDEGILLSGAGNEIKAWACWDQYRPLKDYERMIPSGCGKVRTIAVSGDELQDMVLFVGTTTNCILEVNFSGGRWSTLVQGHSSDLCALTVCPDNKSFITAGYDKLVIKWCSRRHRPHWKSEIYEPATAVTIDQNSELIVVGTAAGMFSVLDAEKGDHMFSYRATRTEIDCMQFSPDGKLLAFGSRDCNIHIYREESGILVKYKKCILAGHKNFVKQLDWSEDSRNLQSVSADLDLKYWKVDTMTEEKAFQHRDFTPDTQTCIVGHNVLGAWISLEDDEEILTMCANRDISDEKRPMKTLAVGNNRGAIRLYQYPCVHPQPSYHERRWHSGKVTCARFMTDGTEEGEFLITTGGQDSSIMQWNMDPSAATRY